MAVTDWQDEARDLRAQGMSERDIAKRIGKAPSTVHGVVKDVVPKPEEVPPGFNGATPDTAPPEGEHFTTSSTAHTATNGHEPDSLERLVGGGPAEPTPGQQSIDGSEVPVPVEEIRVDGTTQLGMFDAGGKHPQSASLRLSGGKVLLVDGQAFRKGDTINFSGTAVVREVGQRDKPDAATGIVVSAEQKHVAQITDLRVNG